jgi:hypothetical protein
MIGRFRHVPSVRRLLAVMLTALTIFVAAAMVTTAAEPGAGLCNRNDAGAPVIADFEVKEGRLVREFIPRFGIAPELDALAGPLRILVFNGDHKAVPVFGQLQTGDAQQTTFRNVVCVSTPTDEWYYYDIDLAGVEGAVP